MEDISQNENKKEDNTKIIPKKITLQAESTKFTYFKEIYPNIKKKEILSHIITDLKRYYLIQELLNLKFLRYPSPKQKTRMLEGINDIITEGTYDITFLGT